MSTIIMRNLIIFAILAICLLALGWIANDAYRDLTNKRTLDGLWMKGYNASTAREIAQQRDNLGDWICVNIKGMSFERAVQTCSHETGHEIFAEYCEKNINDCINLTKTS